MRHWIAVFAVCAAGVAGAQTARVDPALYAGLHWRSIGPYRSGNVYAVAGVPGDPTTYYLGLPEGGVWKTSDGGTVWKPVFDQEAVPSIGSVAVADSEPNLVYVGTGDPTVWSFTPGKGMYKSTDAGRTWQRDGLAGAQYIPNLLVDPHNPQLVLAGTTARRGFGPPQASAGGGFSQGVYRTSDGGANWMRVLAGASVEDLAWDYDDPQMVYALMQAAGPGGRPAAVRLYQSSDEGATWQQLSGAGLPAGLRSATLAVAAGTQGQRLYLLTGGLPGGRAGGVYRSDDGGASWRLGTSKIASAGGRIYVDPKNPDVVYLMGTAMFRSSDGAATFAAYKGAPGGDDYRALWIDPHNPRRMLAGVDQGPSISVDGGHTWTPWYNLPNGQFYDVFTDNQFPYQVYGAQQDSGTAAVVSRSDYGEITFRDWQPVSGFEFSGIAPDPLDPRLVYTQGWYDVLRRFDRKTGQVAVVFTPTPADRWSNLPPTLFSPTDPHRLYVASNVVRSSADGGKSWRQLGADLTQRKPSPGAPPAPPRFGRGAAITALAPSPLDGKLLWAGTSNGLIQLSRDGGARWTNVSPPAFTARTHVENMDASHHDRGTLYVAAGEQGGNRPELYRTEDYGKTWSAIVAGLPENVRTRVVREDPQDASLLYAGTEMGAWVSFDRGDHWQSLQLNLPHTVVSDMHVHGDDLVISTYGRSLWILDDITPLRQIRAAQAVTAAYLFQPETAWRVRWSNNHDTPLPPEVPAGQNPPEGAILDYDLAQPAQGPMRLTIRDSSGRLVREFTNAPPPPDRSMPNVPTYWFKPPAVLDAAAGGHRLVWDLRYPPPQALTYSYYGGLLDYTEYTLTWHAVLGMTPRRIPVGPLVNPGAYQVTLSVDGRNLTRTLTLRNDPRSLASAADLAAQMQVERQVMAGLNASYDAYQHIQQLSAAAKKAGDAALAKSAEALVGNTAPSFGAANRDLGRRLQDLEFGDFRPTASDVVAIRTSCMEITAAMAKLSRLEAKGLPSGMEPASPAWA